ncbi:hypothetical protein ACFWAR_14360 [Streptomyces sp. NPDC059917]|uniref:hypothetical protein n=1 Tax=Streptomyces sp. NPDC059917 TaxID=3347002 RepID=UPI00366621A1
MRSTLAAGLGALALLVTLPASPAAAADGAFSYTYVGPGGISLRHHLTNPESGECIIIPETVGNNFPALAPNNDTNATATVFHDTNCEGDVFYVMNPGRHLSRRLELRSVIFS